MTRDPRQERIRQHNRRRQQELAQVQAQASKRRSGADSDDRREAGRSRAGQEVPFGQTYLGLTLKGIGICVLGVALLVGLNMLRG